MSFLRARARDGLLWRYGADNERAEQQIARELALIGLGLDKRDGDDPWWDHRIGFDRESLLWLRDEVRRPE